MPAKITDKGDNKYLLCVSQGTAGSGKRQYHFRTVVAKSPQAAEREWALFYAAVQRGEVVAQKPMSLNEFFEYWVENYGKPHQEVGTISHNRQLFKRISEHMGAIRIDKIMPKDILDFYKKLAAIEKKNIKRDDKGKPLPGQSLTLSPNSQKKYHILLHTLLGAAQKWGFVAFNAADRVTPPKSHRTIKNIMTEDEIAIFLHLLDSEPTKYKAMVFLGITGGLCKEETFGLIWRDVDFDAGTIRIERASRYVPGAGVIEKEPKNKFRRRTVTLPPDTMDLLRKLKAEQSAKRLKLGGPKSQDGQWAGADKAEDDRIFTAWNGKRAHPDSFYSWSKKFCDAHGLPVVGSHQFRHIAATYLISVGNVSLQTVASKLGHADSSTTQRIYSHLLEKKETETAGIMQGILNQFKTNKAASVK